MLIGISGKKQVGKNTAANMLQFIIENYQEELDADNMFASYLLGYDYDFKFSQQKQFAAKVKQIVALLIGCNIKDLEDESFKNKILPEEWWMYKLPNSQLISYLDKNQPDFIKKYELIKTTPRLLLQKVGTDCFRNIVHPNTWVILAFADYKPVINPKNRSYLSINGKMTDVGINYDIKEYPNWIFTDCRFPNEAKAIKEKNGIIIRVERNTEYNDNHESETALDTWNFDYIVNNNDTFKELFINIYKILKNERYI